MWNLWTAVGLFALSRKRDRRQPAGDPPVRFVVVVPALNEGGVIAATVRHLLAFPVERVIVVDDGSDDDTADQLSAVDDARLVVLLRRLPEARQGKGAALNAAYRWMRTHGFPADDTVVLVADADGRLHPTGLTEAARCFADPAVGACQVSVRIRNRHHSFWARMQHFEFVTFTALYQRGRQHTGAVGLGGNGQFVRLQALENLGPDPWSGCLTEDMDLGIRLLLAGWKTRYIPTSWVTQQAIPGFPRLLRQRTRWFQGALQCLHHLPGVMSSDRLPLKTRVDLAGILLAPLSLLVVSPVVFLGWGEFLVEARTLAAHEPVATSWVMYVAFYVLAFLPAFLLGFLFWLDDPECSLGGGLLAGHCFIFYSYLWTVAGWRGLGRQLFKRDDWVKTARIDEQVVLVPRIAP
jgi:cellulose synthase/poly-beta-1,6-N-acetylglucosamine synthase-like glycosyltransferase